MSHYQLILTFLNADEDFGIKTGHKIAGACRGRHRFSAGLDLLLGTRSPYVMST